MMHRQYSRKEVKRDEKAFKSKGTFKRGCLLEQS
jgi:hypothetical protein